MLTSAVHFERVISELSRSLTSILTQFMICVDRGAQNVSRNGELDAGGPLTAGLGMAGRFGTCSNNDIHQSVTPDRAFETLIASSCSTSVDFEFHQAASFRVEEENSEPWRGGCQGSSKTAAEICAKTFPRPPPVTPPRFDSITCQCRPLPPR